MSATFLCLFALVGFVIAQDDPPRQGHRRGEGHHHHHGQRQGRNIHPFPDADVKPRQQARSRWKTRLKVSQVQFKSATKDGKNLSRDGLASNPRDNRNRRSTSKMPLPELGAEKSDLRRRLYPGGKNEAKGTQRRRVALAKACKPLDADGQTPTVVMPPSA